MGHSMAHELSFDSLCKPITALRSTLLQVGKGTSLRGLDVHKERLRFPLLDKNYTLGF
ncbi:hypothetical protein Phage55_273 [Escherichia phage 55]|nr:hypothetical protein Phage55_273 [Escherichia phage 55]